MANFFVIFDLLSVGNGVAGWLELSILSLSKGVTAG